MADIKKNRSDLLPSDLAKKLLLEARVRLGKGYVTPQSPTSTIEKKVNDIIHELTPLPYMRQPETKP